jgi:hypothetical protein
MKIKLRLLQGGAALTAILALGALCTPTAFSQSVGPLDNLQFCQGPIGSWQYTVPQGTAPAVHGVDSYSPDGGYVTADVIGGLPQTTGIGSWACTGSNTWVLTFFTLIYDPTTGDQIGTLEYRQTATLGRGGNTFSGSGVYEYYDATGAGLGSGSFTITAKRIVAGSALPAYL